MKACSSGFSSFAAAVFLFFLMWAVPASGIDLGVPKTVAPVQPAYMSPAQLSTGPGRHSERDLIGGVHPFIGNSGCCRGGAGDRGHGAEPERNLLGLFPESQGQRLCHRQPDRQSLAHEGHSTSHSIRCGHHRRDGQEQRGRDSDDPRRSRSALRGEAHGASTPEHISRPSPARPTRPGRRLEIYTRRAIHGLLRQFGWEESQRADQLAQRDDLQGRSPRHGAGRLNK